MIHRIILGSPTKFMWFRVIAKTLNHESCGAGGAPELNALLISISGGQHIHGCHHGPDFDQNDDIQLTALLDTVPPWALHMYHCQVSLWAVSCFGNRRGPLMTDVGQFYFTLLYLTLLNGSSNTKGVGWGHASES